MARCVLNELWWPKSENAAALHAVGSNFCRKARTVAGLAVAMIFNESQQEWADRVGGPAATIAIAILTGLYCYVFLIPLIFGYHAAGF